MNALTIFLSLTDFRLFNLLELGFIWVWGFLINSPFYARGHPHYRQAKNLRDSLRISNNLSNIYSYYQDK